MRIVKFFLKSVYLFSTVMFFCLYSLYSQKDIFVIHELGSREGLTDNRYNYYIHKDPTGLIWISSIAGLNRFDGRHIKTYLPDRADTNSLRSVYVSTSQFNDSRDGNLWFTEDEAVIKYNRRQDYFERYYACTQEEKPIEVGYSWSHLDKESGLLWFRLEKDNKRYLYTCDTRQAGHPIKPITQLQIGIKDKMVRTPDGKNQLFSLSRDSLYIHTLDSTGLISSTPIAAPKDVQLYSVLPINHNTTWVATNKGLYAVNVATKVWQAHMGSYENRKINDVRELAVWRSDCLVVATNNKGIYFYNPLIQSYTGKIRRFANDQIEQFDPSLDRIHIDSSHNLWISTKDKGIYYTSLTKPKFELQLTGEAAIAMAGYQTNRPIVLGLEKVYFFNSQEIISAPIPFENDAFVKPKCIFQDDKGRLWLGTEFSLYYKDLHHPSFIKYDHFPDPLSPGNFTSITSLPNGNLLLGNVKASPVQIDSDLMTGSDFTPVSKIETIFVKYLNGFLFTYDNDNFFRIFNYIDNEFIADTTMHPLSIVNHIAVDTTSECFWLATDNGLYKLSQNQTSNWQLELQTQLQERVISSLLLEDNGQIWMGTPRGLLRYHPITADQHLFSDSDLLQDYHFNRTSAWKAPDGGMFFGGANGLNYFTPANIKSNIASAKPLIVDILINQTAGIANDFSGRKTKNPQLIELLILPFSKNNLTLHLSAGEYSDPEECVFIYQLGGSNDEKKDTLNGRILRFNNLSDGKYDLEIWATNADGQVSSDVRKLSITIRRPLLRSIGAILLYILTAFGFGYAYYKNRLKRLNDMRKLEKAVAAAELLAAQTKTAVLRLKMNPHFIFNSLVAIKSLVSKNDQSSALAFLTRFSKLMRKILAESEQQTNSLEEEIELLDNYLALEKMRFKDKMTYSFHIDPNLDAYETLLPTMILQPFVENAIVHGIRNKSTAGHIQINFIAKADDHLCCEVTDNGIGRSATQTKDKSHQSEATNITRQRLKVLSESMNLASIPHFTIIDNFDDDGTSSGTTVRFIFPSFY